MRNVELVTGDGSRGHPEVAPYPAINVAAAAERSVPRALTDQLAEGGRLVIPIDGGDQRLTVIRRHDGRLEQREHEPVRFVALITGGRDE